MDTESEKPEQAAEPQTATPPSQPPVATAASAAVAGPEPLTSWPGAFGLFKFSRDAVRTNLGTIIWLYVIIVIADIVLSAIFRNNQPLRSLLSLLVSVLFVGAMTHVWLQSAKGAKVELEKALSVGASLYLNVLLLYIMTTVVLVVAFLLFIIPGLIVLPRLSLAFYYLVDQKMSAMDAFKASWNGTRGNSGKVWGIIGATIVMILPMFTVIGIPVTIYLVVMYSAALALLYGFLQKNPAPAAS